MEQSQTTREVELKSGAGRALPKTLDPVITMAAVQRFVESERYRTRRIFWWSVSGFLLILAAVVTTFIAVGVVVLKQTRKAAEIVDGVQAQTALYGAELVGMSSKVGRLQELQVLTRGTLEESEAQRLQEGRVLKTDLERFGRWIAASQDKAASTLESLQRRLVEVEAGSAAKEKQLQALRKQYEDLEALSRLGGTIAATGAPSVHVSVVAATASGVPSSTGALAAVIEGRDGASPPDIAAPRDISVVTFPNGDRYEGEFRNGLFHGWGTYTYQKGDRYEGQFANDMKNGKGTYTYVNGDKYVGEFRDDVKSGQGTLFFQNGDRYTGEFAGDRFHGQGALAYQNGNQYTGGFRQGMKYGAGVFKFTNGDRYTGEFQNDERHGQGTYEFRDGSKYVGAFVQGRRHGNGRYLYASGEEYVGEFKDGRKDGVGVCIYPSGVKAKGLWRQDKFMRAMPE
jgi:hypothetical protein